MSHKKLKKKETFFKIWALNKRKTIIFAVESAITEI